MDREGSFEISSSTILVVDDNEDARYALERILLHNGFRVIPANSGTSALERAKEATPDAILLDVSMPEMDGYDVTRHLKSDPVLRFVPVILVTAKDTVEDIIFGLEQGADDYIAKPFKPDELIARLRASLRLRNLYEELKQSHETRASLLEQLSSAYQFSEIIGESTSMQTVFSLLTKVAPTDSPVLITGESGTGKELVARAIHFRSERKERPFIAKNCATFNSQLLESELFGHVKGSFTGAHRDHSGLFEQADTGTLFLDEIGEMSTSLQAKLLRVLQDGTFQSVGSNEEVKVDVRIVAATNRDLAKMVKEGQFREDLFYRLNVIHVELPPLRERDGDVPLLIQHFLDKFADQRGEAPKPITDDAWKILKNYHWKGNVRELENEIQRMLILGVDEQVLGPDVLSQRILQEEIERLDEPEAHTLKSAVEALEREMILKTLIRLSWNKSSVARELGISRSNLLSKIKHYGLSQNE